MLTKPVRQQYGVGQGAAHLTMLSVWVNDEDFDNPDLDDPIIALGQSDLRKFAAMDPVVDLESLRGMKVKLVYDDEV